MSGPLQARLDSELVRRGLAQSRTRAAALVAQGRVRLGGTVVRKSSTAVAADDTLEVQPADGTDYVSRGAHKLDGALDSIDGLGVEGPCVRGARCLDAGASTGGFTQVLLERGAEHVLAVDVGHGQMAARLAQDPRVTLHEGVNVRGLSPEPLGTRPEILVADLSFISLALVAGTLVRLVEPGGHLLLMVKPQFEVGRDRLASTGVVTSLELRQEAVVAVAAAVIDAGGDLRAVVPSPLPGPAGNHEYFLWARAAGSTHGGRTGVPSGVPLSEAVRAAVVDGRATLVEPPAAIDVPGGAR